MSGFVRSKYQLGRWSEGSTATGRRLSDFEARDAYGDTVLREVDRSSAAVLLSSSDAIQFALRNRREQVGLSTAALANYTGLPEALVEAAEGDPSAVSIQDVEKLAFVLGLDERYIALDRTARADGALGVRLRTLTEHPGQQAALAPNVVLRLLEAASLVRVQLRLQQWFGLDFRSFGLQKSDDFGDAGHPAWQVGYRLAAETRQALGLGNVPVDSMRALVEERFGVPVLQCEMPTAIAGATVETAGSRGIVLNTVGQNQNVWVRRATLAHELCHLLFDPEQVLGRVRVDQYQDAESNPELAAGIDFSEQRANAFAVAFIAPPDEVRRMAPGPITSAMVEDVMRHFGLGRVAARFHVWNSAYRNYNVPDEGAIFAAPTDEQQARENLTIDYFQPAATPLQRRGRFAHLVARAVDSEKLSDDTGAQYLCCSVGELRASLRFLLDLA